jgi:hypothetical protein
MSRSLSSCFDECGRPPWSSLTSTGEQAQTYSSDRELALKIVFHVRVARVGPRLEHQIAEIEITKI